jgi:hypothetical protein
MILAAVRAGERMEWRPHLLHEALDFCFRKGAGHGVQQAPHVMLAVLKHHEHTATTSTAHRPKDRKYTSPLGSFQIGEINQTRAQYTSDGEKMGQLQGYGPPTPKQEVCGL